MHTAGVNRTILTDRGTDIPRIALKILVIDDELTSREILGVSLTQEGYTVFMAKNGQEGIAIFDREQPDIVITDILMPVMDGYEATRIIKERAGERFVPVICLTSLADPEDLSRCVEAGADDFLTKPISRIILRAKIDAMMRIRQLHATAREQKDELLSQYARLHREHEIAQKVFAKMVHRGCLNAPNIKFLISPMALFNGDVLLAARRPSGELHIMLGDFTGHGLSASLGAIPASEIFYAMTSTGHSLGEIVMEMNNKLDAVLPADLFLAACLMELDSVRGVLRVWNCALPDVIVPGREGGIKNRLKSRNIPLGVVNSGKLGSVVEITDISQGDRVYVYSDGLIEARNPDGEVFGQGRLDKCFSRSQAPDNLFDEIRTEFDTFCAGESQSDDITMIEITCDKDAVLPIKVETANDPGRTCMTSWKMVTELKGDTLRTGDPLPLITRILAEDKRLYRHKENVYMILAELFSNALEHGLLGLDPNLKKDAEGLARYYIERERALATLDEGSIKIDIEHSLKDEGGRLVVRVEDSGPGFDYHKTLPSLSENIRIGGRGIPLVRSLCQELVYQGRGNRVKAIYAWS